MIKRIDNARNAVNWVMQELSDLRKELEPKTSNTPVPKSRRRLRKGRKEKYSELIKDKK